MTTLTREQWERKEIAAEAARKEGLKNVETRVMNSVDSCTVVVRT